jgi:hypothetical protein
VRSSGSQRNAADSVDTLRIAGRVISAEGYGLPGVTLIATRIGNSGVQGASDSAALEAGTYTRYRAVSGPDGFFAFENLPDGDYTVRNNRHDDFASVRITVRAGVEYADLVLERERSVIVEGVVTDSYDLPLSHVSVLPVVVGAPSVRTDRSGHYRLPITVAPGAGNLTLRFESPGFHEASVTTALPRHAGVSTGAASVAVHARLQPIELTTNVTGHVTDSDGRAVAGRVVVLKPTVGQQRYQAVTGRDGRFEFPVINAPLAYQLSVSGAPGFADHVADILVTRHDYRFDVALDPVATGSLRGRVLDSDGAPISGIELRLRSATAANSEAIVRSDSSGNFVAAGVPAGEVMLSSRSMPNFFVRGLTVAPGAESSAEVVLDLGGHQLSGRVVDRSGRAVPASVVMLRWAHEADGVSSSATRRTATDALGNFRFDQLGPGTHSIVVNAPGFITNTFDHDVGRDGYNVTVRLN